MTNPYFSLLRTAWRYARGERWKFVLAYTLLFCSNLAYGTYPLLYGWFAGKVQTEPARIPSYLLRYIGLYVGLKVIEWSFHGPARVLERQLAFSLSRNFLQERYHQALHLPAKWHQDRHSGATINRIRKSYEALKQFFEGGFTAVYAITRLALSFTAMCIFAPLYGVAGVVLGVLIAWVSVTFDRHVVRAQEEINEEEHVISAKLFDSLSNIMTVITLRLEQSMERGLMANVQRLLAPFRRYTRVNEWKWFVVDTLVAILYCVIVGGYVYEHWRPGVVFSLGGLVALVGYTNQFASVFHDLAAEYNQIVRFHTDVTTAHEIEESFAAHHRGDSVSDLPTGWREASLQNIQYSHRETYEDSQAPHSLHGITIRMERGKRVALVGESGSGKSTLLALLRGLYEPEPGAELLVDGKRYGLSSLNETVTLFPQDPEIFENTIRFNLTLDLPFSAEEIDRACAMSCFSEVLADLPGGLDANIQEKGVNLSGGQKQRLALGRGILAAQDSNVVLLDEPTSSVDPRTEALIYAQLFEEFSNKAMVSALHRLHLLPSFDYIYVLKRGRIVAEGQYTSLLAESEEFRLFCQHQELEARS